MDTELFNLMQHDPFASTAQEDTPIRPIQTIQPPTVVPRPASVMPRLKVNPSVPPLTTPSSFKTLKRGLPEALNSLGTITTDYGGSTKYEKSHPGIDIANVAGTPVSDFVEGTVTATSTGHIHGEKGFGNQVIITDNQGNKHQFSHLQNIYVKPGQAVKKGETIATIGDTGSTYSPKKRGTGAHLDYRIVDAYNKYVSPYQYFNKTT